jgi:hypothetical protein
MSVAIQRSTFQQMSGSLDECDVRDAVIETLTIPTPWNGVLLEKMHRRLRLD